MILDLCSQDVRLEMSKGAKKFLFDRYEDVISLIRHKTQKLLCLPSCIPSLAWFLSSSYGVIKRSFFFTIIVQYVAKEVTLMEFVLKTTSNDHVRPARLPLTIAELTQTDIRGTECHRCS